MVPTYEVTTTWTPDTCTYQAYDSLAGDPFVREALSQQIMIYQAQATTVIDKRGWATKLPNGPNAWGTMS